MLMKLRRMLLDLNLTCNDVRVLGGVLSQVEWKLDQAWQIEVSDLKRNGQAYIDRTAGPCQGPDLARPAARLEVIKVHPAERKIVISVQEIIAAGIDPQVPPLVAGVEVQECVAGCSLFKAQRVDIGLAIDQLDFGTGGPSFELLGEADAGIERHHLIKTCPRIEPPPVQPSGNATDLAPAEPGALPNRNIPSQIGPINPGVMIGKLQLRKGALAVSLGRQFIHVNIVPDVGVIRSEL